MKRLLLVLASFVALSGMAGCPGPQQSASTSPSDTAAAEQQRAQTYARIKQGYAVNQEVRSQTAALVVQRKLSSVKAREMQTLADVARAGLDVASNLYFSSEDAKALAAVKKTEVIHNDIRGTNQEAIDAAGVAK